jgi:signal recognition particle receptor subunit beta
MGDVSPERFDGKRSLPTAVKILIAGGAGVGKSALVEAISEIDPLRTEGTPDDAAFCVAASEGIQTTVLPTDTLDFGRITIDEALILYLFDTPEHSRRWQLRDEVAGGALGAVILADPARLGECVPVIEYFKSRGTPYVVAVTHIAGARDDQLAAVRRTLALDPRVPVAYCDPNLRESARSVLITLLECVRADMYRRAATIMTA